MSKEIIIKSPIKILESMRKGLELDINEGELAIQSKNFTANKYIKTNILCKSGGEIYKASNYVASNYIHLKPMPFGAFPGEVYYTDSLVFHHRFRNTDPETFTVRIPFISEKILTTFPYKTSNDYFKAETYYYVDGYAQIPDFDFPNITLHKSAGEYHRIRINLIYSSKRNVVSLPKKYFSIVATPYGVHVNPLENNCGKIPTMSKIKQLTFYRKKKFLKTKNGNFIKPKKQDKTRLVLSTRQRTGKACLIYCKRRYSSAQKEYKIKRIKTLPVEYCRFWRDRKLPLNIF